MDVCKCIVSPRHGGTLNSCGASSPLMRFVEGEDRWEAADQPQSVLPLNWGGIEPNRSVTCMVLKATANDRRHLAFCHDEFRGPRSGLCRSVELSHPSGTVASDADCCALSSMPKLWRWKSVVSPSNVPSGNFAELIRTVTCMIIKAKANDRRTSSPLPR
ncbi:uncharacterized protein TNCV_2187241 [Trichonephila clavipes]|nr:uncharacterized protein TNCV_2187241 [Trichonephila clavipes]